MQNFNHTRHDHEIHLESSSLVEVCNEDDASQAIPRVQYHVSFTSITEHGRLMQWQSPFFMPASSCKLSAT